MILGPILSEWPEEAREFLKERIAQRVDSHEVPARAERNAIEDTRAWFSVHQPALLASWSREAA